MLQQSYIHLCKNYPEIFFELEHTALTNQSLNLVWYLQASALLIFINDQLLPFFCQFFSTVLYQLQSKRA